MINPQKYAYKTYLYLIMLIGHYGCKPTDSQENAQDQPFKLHSQNADLIPRQDTCEAQPGFVWVDERCVNPTQIAEQKKTCTTAGKVWLESEEICITQAEKDEWLDENR